MAIPLPSQRLLYRGPINWKKVYAGTKGFWGSRKYDVIESNYKDKVNEFEGKWQMEQEVDAYHKFIFNIEFKLWDLSPGGKSPEGDTLYNGKIRIILTGRIEEHFAAGSPAGKKEIFGPKDSRLHDLYRAVTRRDREEALFGQGAGTMFQYMNFLKRECKMEMSVME